MVTRCKHVAQCWKKCAQRPVRDMANNVEMGIGECQQRKRERCKTTTQAKRGMAGAGYNVVSTANDDCIDKPTQLSGEAAP